MDWLQSIIPYEMHNCMNRFFMNETQLMNNGTILLTSKQQLLFQLLWKHTLIVVNLAIKSALIFLFVFYTQCHFLAAETNSYQPTYP